MSLLCVCVCVWQACKCLLKRKKKPLSGGEGTHTDTHISTADQEASDDEEEDDKTDTHTHTTSDVENISTDTHTHTRTLDLSLPSLKKPFGYDLATSVLHLAHAVLGRCLKKKSDKRTHTHDYSGLTVLSLLTSLIDLSSSSATTSLCVYVCVRL